MAKIINDKYYTPDHIVLQCLKTIKEIMIKDGAIPSRVIEPSAGNGAFSKRMRNCLAYDIEPEDNSIQKADYLKMDLGYQPNTLVIGNPPFGERMNLAQKFFAKSVEIADYIAFILPISQLNNTNSMYQFDLIYSVDLGKEIYSDREIHCCFNIYRRPEHGLNAKPKRKLDCVNIVRQDSKKFDTMDYDIKMCYWGNGSAGKILSDDESYSAMYKIKIDPRFKKQCEDVLRNVDWKKELNCVAMLKIQQFHIIKLLQKNVEGIF